MIALRVHSGWVEKTISHHGKKLVWKWLAEKRNEKSYKYRMSITLKVVDETFIQVLMP